MNYIAIDFETAYWGPANACSLGIVTSDGEKVIDEWYHLIHPLSMDFDAQCQKVNGISPADVAEEPAFPLLFEDDPGASEGQVGLCTQCPLRHGRPRLVDRHLRSSRPALLSWRYRPALRQTLARWKITS